MIHQGSDSFHCPVGFAIAWFYGHHILDLHKAPPYSGWVQPSHLSSNEVSDFGTSSLLVCRCPWLRRLPGTPVSLPEDLLYNFLHGPQQFRRESASEAELPCLNPI